MRELKEKNIALVATMKACDFSLTDIISANVTKNIVDHRYKVTITFDDTNYENFVDAVVQFVYSSPEDDEPLVIIDLYRCEEPTMRSYRIVDDDLVDSLTGEVLFQNICL